VIVMSRAAPHEEINRQRTARTERDAWRAQLEAKYGVPYERLPEVLRYEPPVHPQRQYARRFDYLAQLAYRFNYAARRNRLRLIPGPGQLGWRRQRRRYLERLEERRRAEIVVRKLRAKRTGRGKPLDRKAHVHVRERIAAREWRDEL
jgi:hypothetical protein